MFIVLAPDHWPTYRQFKDSIKCYTRKIANSDHFEFTALTLENVTLNAQYCALSVKEQQGQDNVVVFQ